MSALTVTFASRNAPMTLSRKAYLTWIQNSVLEGDLTPATFERLKTDVKKVLDLEYDSVLFYTWRSERYMSREVVGVERGVEDIMI